MFSTQLLTLNYLLYSPTNTAPQFFDKLTPLMHLIARLHTGRQSIERFTYLKNHNEQQHFL